MKLKDVLNIYKPICRHCKKSLKVIEINRYWKVAKLQCPDFETETLNHTSFRVPYSPSNIPELILFNLLLK